MTAYERIRARVHELYPNMKDHEASLIITNGRNKDLIRGIKRGRSKFPRGENLEALATFLKWPVSWLTSPNDPGNVHHIDIQAFDRNAPNGHVTGGNPLEGVTVPLYSSAVGGVEGEFMLDDNRCGDIEAPASLEEVLGAYAVTVSGETMDPRYEDGEVVFVNPQKRVKRGDYVIAQIRPEAGGPTLAYVKRFVSRNAKELVLEQLKPARSLSFDESKVVSVHYILRGGE
ncbi:XRE family transcriptional regulator [Mesorhizobium sp. NBSH29]|uniref:S24 family peptidase n=1 Tax=Mesorhizobium sp. NBSH29 TaxID=2654249 RepID=UPI0018967BFC|nr:helix-turn-helix transcriptional regulator [Mesorhizobium sp. NBSH29]QPC87091.1 XRE family transcriptional regulator [Mesorhizobium sp. NBSH29]